MAKGVRVIDRGLTQILKRMAVAARGQVASVGVQGDKGQLMEHENSTNVEIYAVHEYGTKDGRIPERSSLRSTFDEKLSSYQKELDEVGRKFFSLENYEGELMLLGEKMKKDVIEKIKSGIPPELAPSTIASSPKRKGSIPLWNTGQLVNALTSVIGYRDRVGGDA